MMKVVVLGAGVMGGGMARRLLGAGYQVGIWNRSPDRVDALERDGARRASTPREAAADADVVLSMVADDQASRSVWIGADGALEAARPGTLLIESSTLSPGWITELATRATGRGCALLEAPVTGSKTHAANGQLTFLAGGDTDTLERARPVLDVLGRAVVHLGTIGSGARMKLINNFVCGVQAAALAEAVAMIERTGLDVEAALAILRNGAPGSPLVNAVAPRMSTRDYSVFFMLAHMRKDLAYAIAEGTANGVRLNTAATALQLFDTAIGRGLGQLDFSAIVEAVRAGSANPTRQPVSVATDDDTQ